MTKERLVLINDVPTIFKTNNIKVSSKDNFKSKKQIIDYVSNLKKYMKENDLKTKRNEKSFINELYAHVFLYRKKILASHTEDTDLEENESLFRRFVYSAIYLFF